MTDKYTSRHQSIIDHYYPATSASEVRDILLRHSIDVCVLALEINERLNLGLEPALVTDAAMLHDIGIIATDAPGIHCHGSNKYICHGYVGADMLRAMSVDERVCRVAERHTGAGITPEDIIAYNLPLPGDRTYMPESLLEQLICYADKFYSKSGAMQRKSLDRIRQSMLKFSPETLERFETLHRKFGKWMD